MSKLKAIEILERVVRQCEDHINNYIYGAENEKDKSIKQMFSELRDLSEREANSAREAIKELENLEKEKHVLKIKIEVDEIEAFQQALDQSSLERMRS